MTEIERYQPAAQLDTDPTGGRLVAWAMAANAANQLAKALVTTTFVPKAFENNIGNATAAILAGDELGLSPIAALRSLYVVHGSPALYTRAMVALAQSRGHEIWTELSTSEKVIVCGKRRGSDHVERAEWTIARARAAGYTSNAKYASNPQEMLYAKGAAEVARKIAADVLAGVPFSVEDLELDDTAEASVTTIQRGTTTRRRNLEPVPNDEPPLESAPFEGDMSRPVEEVPLPDEPADGPEMIRPAQITKLQASFGDKGITGRADRLRLASKLAGRELTTSKDLTKDEASALIDALETGSWVALDPALAELLGAG